MKVSYEELEKRVIELEKLENEYKLKAEKYSILFNQSPNGIAVIDSIDGKILDFNDQLCFQLGYTREEFIGIRIADFEYMESEADTKSHIEKIIREGKDTFETKHKTKKGEIRDVLMIVQTFKVGEENLFHCIFRDITNQKITENELIENNKLFKKLSEQVPGVIYQYRYHPDGRNYFPFASDNLNKIYAVTPEEVQIDGSKVLSRIHPEDYDSVLAKIFKSYETLELWEDDYRVILPERGERWLRDIARPEKLEDDSVLWHGYIADITDRKQADIELRNQRERFELAVRGTNDGIWDWNLVTNELFLSTRWKEMLGYNDDELANEFITFLSLLHKDDISRVESYVSRYLQGEFKDYEIEFRMIHKDGSPRWILAKGEAIRNELNVPIRMAGSHSDITKRKLAELYLKESEAQLDNALKLAKMGKWELDIKRGVFILNDNFYGIFGTNVEEMGGYEMTIQEYAEKFVHPDDAYLVAEESGKAIATSDPNYQGYIEHRIKFIDGSIGYIAVRFFIEKDEDGNTIKTIGVNQDITELKKAELALKVSEERWHFAIDGSGDGLWDWDVVNNKVYFSHQWKAMLGFAEDEIADGLDEWEKRVHPDDLKSCYDDLNNHFMGKTPIYQNVHRVICKDGTHKWILDRGKVVEWKEDGSPKRVIGTHRDVTAEKEREQEIKKLLEDISLANQELEANLFQKNALIERLEDTRNKLELANQEKDKFFSIIAHDLRSPFGGFIGLTKILVDDIYDLSMREFHEYSKALHDSAENLYKLLDNLLTWSSLKRDAMIFNPREVNLKDSIDDVVKLQKASIENKNQKIEVDLSPELLVFADLQMLNTLIRNLLSNAIKFTPKEGTIKISAKDKEENIEVSITDSGIGIPESMMENLFTLGNKTSRNGTDNEPSTGLGLILCKEFVEKNNGRIWVESKENEGTTFYFTLPKLAD